MGFAHAVWNDGDKIIPSAAGKARGGEAAARQDIIVAQYLIHDTLDEKGLNAAVFTSDFESLGIA
jgi:hypothetical protein